MMMKSYNELITIPTFEERFRYLKVYGVIGDQTFGNDRYLNQKLYTLSKWKRVRDKVILRDNGCDLGCEGFEIYSKIIVHHINPITVEDIVAGNPCVFDLNNLISTSHNTHNAIHYGDEKLLIVAPIERKQYDTCPWRH
jgi:hypothetical protein